ncbi:hypothetical protein HY642_00675 [Candidatus Woesearchaeota archaeon]|nr:hypothetical protein [Candidatus Woesearchaeota archaeon]
MGGEQKKRDIPAGWKERVIFTYSIEHLLKKDKVRFYYALKGRDGKHGIVVAAGIEQLGRCVLLVPYDQAPEVADFLKYWKCDFAQREVLVQ